MNIAPKCFNCNAQTKISSTYTDMWFCPKCGKGDFLKNKENNKIIIEILGPAGCGRATSMTCLYVDLTKKNYKAKLVKEDLPMFLGPFPKKPDPLNEEYSEKLFDFSESTINISEDNLTYYKALYADPHLIDHYQEREKNKIKTIIFYLNNFPRNLSSSMTREINLAKNNMEVFFNKKAKNLDISYFEVDRDSKKILNIIENI